MDKTDESKLVVYYLKSGIIIAAKDINVVRLSNVLQITLIPTGAGSAHVIGVALGYPINKKPITILMEKLDIMFEIELDEETRKKVEKVYTEGLYNIDHPTVRTPKSKIIQ